MREPKLESRQLARLYREIGGEPALERILVRFYAAMSKDILIGFFFAGRDTRRIALKQKEFLMKAWGVAPSYAGRSPAEAHRHLPPILRGHFDRRIAILRETLREAGVPEDLASAWVAFERAFRRAVQAG